MKCPLCKAPTEVKHTSTKDGVPTRRRHCFNGHTFITQEVAITAPRPVRKYTKSAPVPQSPD